MMNAETLEFFKEISDSRAKRAKKRPRADEVVPDVLVHNVARYLGVEDLGRMMQVSQQFNRVIRNSSDLWNRHYEEMSIEAILPIGNTRVRGYERLRLAHAWAKKGFLRQRNKFRLVIDKKAKKQNSESQNSNSSAISLINTKHLLIMVMNNKLYEYPKVHLREHTSFQPKLIAQIGKGFSKKFTSLDYCSKSKVLLSGFDNGEVGVAKLSGKAKDGRGFMQKIIGEEINSVSCVERNFCVTSTDKLEILRLNEKGDWLDRYDYDKLDLQLIIIF